MVETTPVRAGIDPKIAQATHVADALNFHIFDVGAYSGPSREDDPVGQPTWTWDMDAVSRASTSLQADGLTEALFASMPDKAVQLRRLFLAVEAVHLIVLDWRARPWNAVQAQHEEDARSRQATADEVMNSFFDFYQKSAAILRQLS